MRAAVVGTGWGRVHVHALRRAGARVVAVCGAPEDAPRTSTFAHELDIPLAVDDPRALLEMDLDVVTVATPARTHQDMLSLFRDVPLICEKPVVGVTGDLDRLPQDGAPTYVNYAFSFLDSAAVFARALEQHGPPSRVSVESDYDLPLSFTGPEWFLEVASHPLSLIVHLLGEPTPVTASTTTGARELTRLDLTVGAVEVRAVSRRVPGLKGLRHTVRADTAAGVLELTGAFRAGQPWRFEPVRLHATALDDGEWTADDCWHRANHRSFGAALEAIRTGTASRQAPDRRLFSTSRAAVIDRCLQHALR